MYCENCGKKLIRGYQFCMECGTPVPPEVEEEEENEDAQANEQSASEQPSGEMPGIQPIGNEEQEEQNTWKICGEIVDRVTKIAIRLMRESYGQCMKENIIELLKYLKFELETVNENT